MDMVYTFIVAHQGIHGPISAGMKIPEVGSLDCILATFWPILQVHFVQAGLAIVWGTDGKPSKAFLVEELINETQGDFCKFIHNTSAKPIPGADDPDYPVAIFLCFVQHVQWTKTGGLAFVSDFQGV